MASEQCWLGGRPRHQQECEPQITTYEPTQGCDTVNNFKSSAPWMKKNQRIYGCHNNRASWDTTAVYTFRWSGMCHSPPHALQTRILFQHIVAQVGAGSFHSDSLSSRILSFLLLFFNLLRTRKLMPFQFPYCPQRQPPHLVFLLLDISPKPYWVLVLQSAWRDLGQSQVPTNSPEEAQQGPHPWSAGEQDPQSSQQQQQTDQVAVLCESLSWTAALQSLHGRLNGTIPTGAQGCLPVTNRSSAVSWAWGTVAYLTDPLTSMTVLILLTVWPTP